MSVTRVAVAGSTGSIGRQTLDVVAEAVGAFEVTALGASGRNLDALVAQAEQVEPKIVAVALEEVGPELERRLPGVEVRAGADAMVSLAEEADVVVNGVVGFAGLSVTIAALTAGRRLALANKESLIAGGPVVQAARLEGAGELVPVDSEHAAIHQCLRSGHAAEVARLVLTASGGPFRGRSAADLTHVTVADALTHPTWDMGPKITVDSSTLMNKGLEVIEANELFGVPAGTSGVGIAIDQIEVVVHPQSTVHSMVEFVDGATIAQLSRPDMRLAIGYALGHPGRLTVPYGRLDWTEPAILEFEPPDLVTFPCLALAFEVARVGGSAPAWMNASNEVAVSAFLVGRIGWSAIVEVIQRSLESHVSTPLHSVEAVVEVDRLARRAAESAVEGLVA